MSKHHAYRIHVDWTGNNGTGTSDYAAYFRDHTITAPNKNEIYASSDTAFRGDAAKYNPEELFLSSIASCHMLWYLHLCADNDIIVESYSDDATGSMLEAGQDGRGGHFTEVVLHPRITVAEESMIEKAMELHSEAHHHCFIANSCNFPIRVEAKVQVALEH